MGRTYYLAETRAQIEHFLGRRLNADETHVLNREAMVGFGKGSTIIFMGGWEHSVKDPKRFEQEAMLRQLAGALVIDAPWDRPSQPRQQWGVSIPQMWARQAGKRLLQERIWSELAKTMTPWEPEKRITILQRWQRRARAWASGRRIALARWIAGKDWPDEW